MPDRDCVYQNCRGVSNGQKAAVCRRCARAHMGGTRAIIAAVMMAVSTIGIAAAQEGDAPVEAPQTETRGASGLPIPRFVSIASGEVNMRTGPGQRYPIDWVYTRRGLPVEVIGEYDLWRQVRDIDGDEGWVHKQLLSGRRTALVTADSVLLRDKADPTSPPVLRAGQGVQGVIDRCDAEWCRMEVDGTRGWVQKDALWGVYPAEVFR